jgi:hypothetical protein
VTCSTISVALLREDASPSGGYRYVNQSIHSATLHYAIHPPISLLLIIFFVFIIFLLLIQAKPMDVDYPASKLANHGARLACVCLS